MSTLEVDLGKRSYPIYIGEDLLTQADLYNRHISGRNVLIVTDDHIAPHYLAPVQAALSNFTCQSVILPHGEANKNLDTVNLIFDALLRDRMDRNCTIVALGGGVVGDITGFAAATYQRGVSCLQIPTSLLAQVDSSVGGKTGVNHEQGKNMIGAFHQPCCVIADMQTLQTLPATELSAGLAEVIKYGLIDDAPFFERTTELMPRLLELESSSLAYIVNTCCANKARIVAQDERESGCRALLNLGHTFGHAIENATGYGSWLHGEAVAAGICMAASLSQSLGLLDASQVSRVHQTLQAANLPIAPPTNLNPDSFLDLMSRDKKVRDNILTLVLLRDIGEAFLSTDYSREKLKACITNYFRPGIQDASTIKPQC